MRYLVSCILFLRYFPLPLKRFYGVWLGYAPRREFTRASIPHWLDGGLRQGLSCGKHCTAGICLCKQKPRAQVTRIATVSRTSAPSSGANRTRRVQEFPFLFSLSLFFSLCAPWWEEIVIHKGWRLVISSEIEPGLEFSGSFSTLHRWQIDGWFQFWFGSAVIKKTISQK